MISSLSDFLIIVIIAILLMGGEKDIANTIKNFSKTLNEFQRRRAELVNELRRELGEVTGNLNEITNTFNETSITLNNEMRRNLVMPNPDNEARIRELEERVRILEEELQRLRGNKDGDGKTTG